MLMIGDTVKLLDEDVELARDMATKIVAIRTKSGKLKYTYAKNLSKFETWFNGLRAEIAFCREMGVEPDTTITNRNHTRVDCTIEGVQIDVKNGKLPYYNLLVALYTKPTDVDAFVLMNCDYGENVFIFKGAELASVVVKKENIRTEGLVEPAYFWENRKLKELKDVICEYK